MLQHFVSDIEPLEINGQVCRASALQWILPAIKSFSVNVRGDEGTIQGL